MSESIQQLKQILPTLENFYKKPKITYDQYEFILQLAQRVDPGRPAQEVVKRIAGIEVSNLRNLARAEGYKAIQSLKEEVSLMV